MSQPLTVTVLDGSGQVVGNPVLAYTSSDAARVGVSASGVVSALAPGEAVVTVSSDAASAYVSVRALSPARVLLTPASATAAVDDTLLFAAQVLDYAGLPVPGAPVTFESSDPAVLQVIGPLGRVRAVGAGQARIRARSGTTLDSATVAVYGTPAQLTITPDSLAVAVALTLAITVQVRDALGQVIPNATVTFQSGNTAIATVAAGGAVTAHQIGVTTVIARSGAASDTIPVVATAAALEVTPASVLLEAGDTIRLVAVARDGLGATIPGVRFTYRSSDPTVAGVDTAGLITFAGVGSADIVTDGGYRSDTTVVLALVAHVPLADAPFGVAVSAGDAVYVVRANAGVARLDPATWQPGATIVVGSVPTDVTFNAAGTRAYVTNQFSQSVSVLDPGTDTELGRIPIPADPYVSRVAPGDSILYVSTNAGRVYGIRLATGAIRDSIPAGLVNGLVVRDTLLYASVLDGSVVEYNLRTLTVGRTLVGSGRGQGIVISPDGSELYVADENGSLRFWDLASGAQIASLPLPGGPFGVAQQPGTGLLFVSGVFQGTVYVVDPATRTLRRTLPVGGITRRIAFRANGDGVVTNESGWVDVIR